MKRTLFIGDSHLPRLKKASESIVNSEREVFFLSLPGPTSSLLSISNGGVSIQQDKNSIEKLESHPRAGEIDFSKWIDSAVNTVKEISGNKSVNLVEFDEVVFVGFQSMNPEVWFEVVAELISGKISKSFFFEVIKSIHILNRHKSKSVLFQLLAAVSELSVEIFVCHTPQRGEVNNKYLEEIRAKNLDGSIVLNSIEDTYAKIESELYNVKLIKFPKLLLGNSKVFTDERYQKSLKDNVHLSQHASEIYYEYIIENLDSNY